MKNILVLNMGMKSIRSIVYSDNGEKLSFAARPIQTMLNAECVEQDTNEWWNCAAEVIKESLIDIGKDSVDYLTVTASSSCLVSINKNVKPLGNCIMVSDRRAVEEAKEIENTKSYKRIKDNTGLSSDASLMLPKILWIKKNQTELFEQTYKFLSPDDYLIAKMTDKFVTDCFNAQKYFYDLKTNAYPEDLLKELGIPLNTLPEVYMPGKEIGKITESAALFLGLPIKTRVILSTYDAICSFFGSGVSEDGEASDVSGTVTVFRALSTVKDLKSNPNIFITPYPKKNLNIVGGSNNLGGGLIEWVKQCYYMNEQYPYEIMEKDAREAEIGGNGLVFLPYLLGERAPIWNNDARGIFFGLERSHTRKEMTRAVFESAGFIDYDMMKAIEQTGVRVNSIRLSGGLARINLVSQIKADITGKDIHVLSDFETTASGAAILSLVGLGCFKSLKEASDVFVSVRMVIKPNLQNFEKYQKLYRLYKDIYETSKTLFEERKEILNNLYKKHEIRIANM